MFSNHDSLAQSRTFAVFEGLITEVTDPEPALAVFKAGDIVDSKYKIERLIGRGGMGAVYTATHVLLNKQIAIKTLLTHLDQEAFERFHREALSLGKFRHKHIVEVFDFGIVSERPYFTMELLAEETLADRIRKKGTLSQQQAIAIFAQVADALAYAHRLNIVHRDIKPGNILIQVANDRDAIKLVDFGLAKLISERQSGLNQFATRSGAIFGSPLYMSPEQSNGGEIDHRTDIYSFGCAFFETLTGRPPFAEENAIATIMAHQTKQAPTLKQALPGSVFGGRMEALIARCLKKAAEDRFQSFEQILEEIKLVQTPEQIYSGGNKVEPQRSTNKNQNVSDPKPAQKKAPLIAVATGTGLFLIASVVIATFVSQSITAGKQKIALVAVQLKSDCEEKLSAQQEERPALPANEQIKITRQADAAGVTYTFSKHSGVAKIGFYKDESVHLIHTQLCQGTVRLPSSHRVFPALRDGYYACISQRISERHNRLNLV